MQTNFLDHRHFDQAVSYFVSLNDNRRLLNNTILAFCAKRETHCSTLYHSVLPLSCYSSTVKKENIDFILKHVRATLRKEEDTKITLKGHVIARRDVKVCLLLASLIIILKSVDAEEACKIVNKNAAVITKGLFDSFTSSHVIAKPLVAFYKDLVAITKVVRNVKSFKVFEDLSSRFLEHPFNSSLSKVLPFILECHVNLLDAEINIKESCRLNFSLIFKYNISRIPNWTETLERIYYATGKDIEKQKYLRLMLEASKITYWIFSNEMMNASPWQNFLNFFITEEAVNFTCETFLIPLLTFYRNEKLLPWLFSNLNIEYEKRMSDFLFEEIKSQRQLPDTLTLFAKIMIGFGNVNYKKCLLPLIGHPCCQIRFLMAQGIGYQIETFDDPSEEFYELINNGKYFETWKQRELISIISKSFVEKMLMKRRNGLIIKYDQLKSLCDLFKKICCFKVGKEWKEKQKFMFLVFGCLRGGLFLYPVLWNVFTELIKSFRSSSFWFVRFCVMENIVQLVEDLSYFQSADISDFVEFVYSLINLCTDDNAQIDTLKNVLEFSIAKIRSKENFRESLREERESFRDLNVAIKEKKESFREIKVPEEFEVAASNDLSDLLNEIDRLILNESPKTIKVADKVIVDDKSSQRKGENIKRPSSGNPKEPSNVETALIDSSRVSPSTKEPTSGNIRNEPSRVETALIDKDPLKVSKASIEDFKSNEELIDQELNVLNSSPLNIKELLNADNKDTSMAELRSETEMFFSMEQLLPEDDKENSNVQQKDFRDMNEDKLRRQIISLFNKIDKSSQIEMIKQVFSLDPSLFIKYFNQQPHQIKLSYFKKGIEKMNNYISKSTNSFRGSLSLAKMFSLVKDQCQLDETNKRNAMVPKLIDSSSDEDSIDEFSTFELLNILKNTMPNKI